MNSNQNPSDDSHLKPQPFDASLFYATENEGEYLIPKWTLADDNSGLVQKESASWAVLQFCRGTKDTPIKERKAGILQQTVVEALIYDLQEANKKVPSRETSIVITKLEEALLWIQKRSSDRKKRGVQFTQNS